MLLSLLYITLLTGFSFVSSTGLIPGTIYFTDGKSLQSGILTPTLKYQASGVLKQGGCSEDVQITQCFAMVLTATGELAPLKRDIGQIPILTSVDSEVTRIGETLHLEKRSAPRQRIEILTWPPTIDGQKNLYKWRTYLVSTVHSSSHFFHIVQLFSRTSAGFVIALGLLNGRLIISDNIRPNCGGTCPSISLEEVWGKTLYHRMVVEWGPNGCIDYSVEDVTSKKIIIQYKVKGNVPSNGSLKTGLYRAALSTNGEAVGYVGDFDFTQRL